MKKKLISLLLILVLVIGLTAIGVAAEEATPAVHEHCVCGGKGDGRGDHVCATSGVITWTPFSLDVCETMADGRLIIPSGNYYLAEDLKTDKAFVILPDTEVSICLNGKTLESSSRVFRVHGILNISECTNGTGKVIGANGSDAPVFYIGGKGHINHYRGILRASQDTKNYGGVGAVANDTLTGYVEERASGSMIMYGGTLDASKVTLVQATNDKEEKVQGYGGALVIFGNAAAPCSFTQYGGTIKGAKSVETNGAAIYAPSTATVQILGGIVESGTAKNLGDGIYCVKGCALTVGGSANIEDLYVPGSQTFTTQNLTGSVGLTAHVTNSAVLTTVATADEAAKFTSNVTGRSVIATESEGSYQITLGHAAHCECGGNLTGVAAENHTCDETLPTWMPLTAAIMDDVYKNTAIPADNVLGVSKEDEDGKGSSAFNRFLDDYDTGHFYLTENISYTYPIDIHTNDDITICLNGYTLSCTNGTNPAFRVWGKLTICDCTGEGHLTGKAKGDSNNGYGAVISMRNDYADATNGTVVNIYGGTIKAVDADNTLAAGTIAVGHKSSATPAVLNIYGGTITGGQATTGGNINLGYTTAAVMNMYGGTISGGTTTGNGGNISCTAGTVNIYAGTISGGTAAGNGGNISCTAGIVNMYGGTISDGTSTSTTGGGNIYVSVASATDGRRGVFNMSGGIITGGTAAGNGGNIYLNATKDDTTCVAECNIQNGTITNGSAAKRGGNIYINRGYFTMDGGTVTGGSLTTHERGLDIGLGANNPVSMTLDGEVTIGEIGVHGHSSNTYAVNLGENFSTKTPIAIQSANLSKVIVNADASLLASFVPVNENAQLTCEQDSEDKSYDIWMRSLDEHYACRCGGAHIGESYHGNCDYVKWTALTTDLINGYTYEETTEVTDESTGETSTVTNTVTVPGLEEYENTSSSTALAGTYDILPAGYYYLTGDLTLDQALYIAEKTKVFIDLNGHTLTAGENAMRALLAKGELNICDSAFDASATAIEDKYQGGIVGTREISYNVLYALNGSIVRIYGGDISTAVAKNSTSQGPVGVSGTLYLFEGTITGTEVTADGGTVAINDAGVIHMYNGKISGGTARRGGNINIASGAKLYVRGGEISGGHAYGAASGTYGGGGNIYAAGNVTISGGTISGGTATRTQSSAQAYGGNIYMNSTSKTLEITGGTITGGSAVTGGNIFTRGEFTMSGGTVSDGEATSAIAGNIRIEESASSCNITGGTISNGVAYQQGGNLVVRNSDKEVIIKDCTVSGGISQTSHGGNIYLTGVGANVTMENVTITGGTAVNRAGNLYITGAVEGITATLTGCTITDGITGDRGGNIYLADVACTMNDCTVTGGSVVGTEENQVGADLYGYNIAANTGSYATSLTINGGNYGGAGENNISLTSVHILSSDDPFAVTVTGAPVIDDLRLGTDRMLTAQELTEGAAIGISRFEITGLFAPGAAQYAQYFTGVTEGTSVAVEGEDLVLVSSMPYWAFDVECNAIAPANTIAEAMAMENASFVRMVSDYETTETITGDLYLDLYGHDLSGLTVNGNLYVVDYATNDYEEDVWGSFSGTVTGTINDGKTVYSDANKEHFNVSNTYVKLANEDGSYSFHRVSVVISHISLDPANDALGYKATVSGDSAVLAAITGYGFNMGVEGGVTKTCTLDGAPTDGVFTLRLQGIMAANGGEMTIIGQPFVIFGEDTVTGSEKKTSMKEAVEAVETVVEEDANAYTEAQMTAVQQLIEAYESYMTDWNIDAIKAWTVPTVEETPAA